MSFDVVTIGDPTMDTFVKIHEAHLALQVKPQETQLCIDYADKIPVDELHRSLGGSCVNAAVATARLELSTAVYGLTGDDQEGRLIVADLQNEGISTALMAVDRAHTTNASIALVFRGERTLFVWHQARKYDLPELPRTDWIYATSVGPRSPSVSRLHSALCTQLDHTQALLAFSPGTHQLRMGRRALAPLLERSHVLLLNTHEACELAGREEAPKQMLEALRRMGPKTVVMTDGTRGSYAFDGERFLRVGILPAPVVDRTGAGDAYGATVVAALKLGHPLSLAMAWGTASAAQVVGVYGATPGLPHRRRLESMVKKHAELIAHEF